MPIVRIYWSKVPSDVAVLKNPGQIFALWPGPVDNDLCFEKAGFTDFADSDKLWDDDFRAIVETVFRSLSAQGSPVLIAGELPVRRVSLLRKKTGSLVDAVVCAATSDEFAHCCIGFGNPPNAHLVVSDGHPILWIYPDSLIDMPDMIKDVAGSREIVESALDWSVLAPDHGHIT